MKMPSIKIQLAIFLAVFGVCLSAAFKEAAFSFFLLISVASATFFDAALNFFKTKKIKITESSLISGLIIGFILSSSQSWWIFPLAAFLAIISKHFIRINNKHIFNPAAFGVFFTVLIFKAFTQWSGTDLWYVLIPLGGYFAWKTRKMEMALVYFLASIVLFGGWALFHGEPLLPILIYQNYFFVFIMLIEPRTTPVKRIGKNLFSTGVAALVFLLAVLKVPLEAEMCSLLVLNLVVPALNKIP